jgi:hypothetical protein
MADVIIDIPGNDAPVQLSPGDTLTIDFTKDVCIHVHHGSSLNPRLNTGCHNSGDRYEGTAVEDDTVIIVHEEEDDDYGKHAKVAGMRTIKIGSGLELFEAFRREIETRDEFSSTFCECWPCAKKVLELILKSSSIPVPIWVKTFLLSLIKAGDLAHEKFCKRKPE